MNFIFQVYVICVSNNSFLFDNICFNIALSKFNINILKLGVINLKKRQAKILILLYSVCFLVVIGLFPSSVFAATPADQTFDSNEDVVDGVNTLQLDGIEYSTNNNNSGSGNIIAVVGCTALVTNPANAMISPYFSGNALTNDLGFSAEPTFLRMSSLDLANNFKMHSMYFLISDFGAGTSINIKGFDGGANGTLVKEVNGIDVSQPSITTETVDFVRDIYDNANGEYGGLLTFGEEWTEIDTILITNSSTGGALYAVVDSLDFSNVVDISVSDATIKEDAGIANFTVSLSKAYATDVTVDYATADGTATTIAADYSNSSETVTIAQGSTSETISVPINNDTDYEQNESFYLNLSNPSVGGIIDDQGMCTITDNDTAPTVTLSTNKTSLSENVENATITATLSNKSYQDVTVNLAYSGNAVNGTDYTSVGTITVPVGSLSATATVTTIDNSKYEAAKNILIEISGVTNGSDSGTQQQTIAVTEDETQPSVTLDISPKTILENGGDATVTAMLSHLSYQDVTVVLGFTGTAANGVDYDCSGPTITIPADSLSASVTLTAIDNMAYSGDKTIVVDIFSVQNGNEDGTQQVTVDLINNELPPTVTLSTSGTTVAENGGSATITAQLSVTTTEDVIVNLDFTGTALVGADYSASANTITIPAGELSGSMTITALNDTTHETSETIMVDITSVTGGVENGTQQIAMNITDDDAKPTITLSTDKTSISENVETATITATLSNKSYQDVTVNLTYSGTAVNGTDYISAGTITIPAGSLSATATVTTIDNSAYEAAKNILIDISGVTNAADSGTQQQAIAIVEDESQPSVTLGISPLNIPENGGSATVTAMLSHLSYQDVTVTLGFTGTATSGVYYAYPPTTIVIPAGVLSGSITLTPTDNSAYTGNKTVIVDILSVANGTEDGTQEVTANFIDDETPPAVVLGITGSMLAENGGTATITATLSCIAIEDVVVNLGFKGTALKDADYTTSANMITIPTGSLSNSITLTAIDDTAYETAENIVVNITDINIAVETTPQQVTATIIDNDAEPTITLSTDKTSISENAETAAITATLSNVSYQAVTVELGFSGTAVSGTDYTVSPTIIVIPSGQLTATAIVTSQNNSAYESDKTVSVEIADVINAIEAVAQQVQITITEDETQPLVSLAVEPTSFVENGGVATVTATLSYTTYKNVNVTFDFAGTAVNGTDYTPSAVNLIIPAGSTSNSITLTGIDNAIYTGDKTINIGIASVDNATENGTQQVTATLMDNESAPTVTLSTSASTLAEDEGNLTVTATLSSTSSQPTTVNLGFTGTAVNGTDYTASENSIVIPAGSLSGTVTLTAVNNIAYTGSKDITINISSVINAIENGTQQVNITLTDDETEPSVTLSTVATTFVKEGGTAAITAQLSHTSYQQVTVDLGFGGTAQIGTDYSTSANSIVIPAGSLSEAITLTGLNNTVSSSVYAGDKTVVVSIDNLINAIENGTQEKTLTIVEGKADPTASLSISSPILAEAATATVIVTLSSVSTQDVFVGFDFTGTAASEDYTVSANSIFIPAGELTGYITLTAKDDQIDEEDQTVIVTIANITGVSVSGVSQVVATILDDDAMPELMINDPVVSKGSSALAYTVTLNAQSEKNITVDYSAISGTTVLANGTLVFNPLATSKLITIPVSSTDSTVLVTLANPANAVIQKAQGTGRVTEDTQDDSDTTDGSTTTTTTTEITKDYKAEVTSANRDMNNSTKVTTSEGIKTTTVTVDDAAIQASIKNMKENNRIVSIAVNNSSDVVEAILNGQTISDMEQKAAVLEIKTENLTYIIAANEMNIGGVLGQLGENINLKDLKVEVRVSNASAEAAKVVKDVASKEGYQLVVSPVEFEIACTASGKSVTVSRFNSYVERTIAIPNSVDPSKITTAVVLNSDGTFSHVPTHVKHVGDKYYAVINSLTNSVYTVIWNPVTFSDVQNHWAKDYVNEVGSRLIDEGTGAGTFSPDRDITRAEFATMLVKALGLRGTNFTVKFGDVDSNYSDYKYICTAYEYGVIAGYTNGNFGPEDRITREQAMTMISRAMKIANMDVNISDTDVNNQLIRFKDSANVSSYATNAVAICTASGIFNGNTNAELTPADNFTRAESATVMIKLLKAAGLI